MENSDLWYKTAIIYSLDVETFQDSTGDGVGDFRGLTERLDYLSALGVTCLWLLPFYPSPNRDNGYDVKDYYGVDPRLGSPGDFFAFSEAARERGLRIIVDLVVNHTSDQHPWFQAARQDPHSRYRDYYLWSEQEPPNAAEGIVFHGVQESTWTYDEVAGAYYFHRFYRHQPDLNITNPEVRAEICRIMGFWLALGVSGFRVDAAPFLIRLPEGEGHSYEYLHDMHRYISRRRPEAILLAEANVDDATIHHYFGAGDRMQMAFNFLVNQELFLALAREDARPLAHSLRTLPALPPEGQWVNFLRNHDELDLGRLTDGEREEVFAAFAPREDMQLYHRGIRRRLAPMLHNDRGRLDLAYSLLLSLPGTPLLRYGCEIGMGDNLSLPERTSVRTPMQWSAAEHGGFAPASAGQLVRPPISGGDYGFEQLNVDSQRGDPRSLLNWMRHAIRIRREYSAPGCATWEVLDSDTPAVIALRYLGPHGALIAAHNLAGQPCAAEIHLPDGDATAVDLLSDQQYEPAQLGAGRRLPLGPFGYRWLRQ